VISYIQCKIVVSFIDVHKEFWDLACNWTKLCLLAPHNEEMTYHGGNEDILIRGL
jgi:hypothetical protein